MGPRWLRPAIAAVAVAGAVTIAAQNWETSASRWAVPVALLTAVPWVLSAYGVRVPTLVWVAVVIGSTLALLTTSVPNDFAPFQLVALVAFAAMALPRAESILILLTAVGVMLGADLAGWFMGSFFWSLGTTLAWFGGYSSRLQQQLVAEAHASQAETAKLAASEERERIARDLHDVVAHSLAVTMLNLSCARLAFERDPSEAYRAIVQAERHGRQSLIDIRRAVGLLAPMSKSPIAPMPTASDVRALVDEFQQAGLLVRLTVSGDLDSLPTTLGLALYRIMQESLANVSKHAPGVAAIAEVVLDEDCVRLAVVNRSTRIDRGDGRGVAGMRQRAGLLGGSLDAGVRDGSWRVEAVLPIDPSR